MMGVHHVEYSRNVVTPVDAGHQQKAQFIDETRLEEGAIDMPAAFEQQPSNSKVFTEQIDGFNKINLSSANLQLLCRPCSV
jgi:hypothetical protein